jgi:SagB-type dehydrogenase family enzyme
MTALDYWADAIDRPLATLLNGPVHMAEGDPREPLKFLAYRGPDRIPLPPPALSLGSAHDLGTFLYHCYGVNRHDLRPGAGPGGWPYHRVVPSARCFFPTELFLVLPSGAYYYDPMHHALVRLHDGDHVGTVAAALGADLTGTSGVVLLASVFWKTAFRYGDYAYRLCTQEAGMVAGNVLLVAAAQGLAAHVHFLFRDAVLDRLLGLAAPGENTLVALALYPGERPLRPAEAQPEPLPLLDVRYLQPSSYDPAALPVLTEIGRASRWTTGGPVDRAWTRPVPPAWNAEDIPDLAALLRRRDSGPGYPDFVPAEVPGEVVSRIARAVARPYPTDLVPADTAPPGECFLAIRSVAGIAEGIWRVRPDGGLDRVREGPVREGPVPVPGGTLTGSFAGASLTAFITGPRALAQQRFGARSFRILNQAAGILAQRVCVLAASGGLSARVHNGYSAAAAGELLGLTGTGDAVLFQIVIGVGRPDSVLRLPVVF